MTHDLYQPQLIVSPLETFNSNETWIKMDRTVFKDRAYRPFIFRAVISVQKEYRTSRLLLGGVKSTPRTAISVHFQL